MSKRHLRNLEPWCCVFEMKKAKLKKGYPMIGDLMNAKKPALESRFTSLPSNPNYDIEH
jgi:hypothetical protein